MNPVVELVDFMQRPARISQRRAVKAALALVFASSVAVPQTVWAHHSFSMFDMAKTAVVTGTVTKFSWRMPHVWISLKIRKPSGEIVEWAGECHAPNIIARKGWNRESVKAGDKISVKMHPMRDGSDMGSVISIQLSDGTVLWNAESESRV